MQRAASITTGPGPCRTAPPNASWTIRTSACGISMARCMARRRSWTRCGRSSATRSPPFPARTSHVPKHRKHENDVLKHRAQTMRGVPAAHGIQPSSTGSAVAGTSASRRCRPSSGAEALKQYTMVRDRLHRAGLRLHERVRHRLARAASRGRAGVRSKRSGESSGARRTCSGSPVREAAAVRLRRIPHAHRSWTRSRAPTAGTTARNLKLQRADSRTRSIPTASLRPASRASGRPASARHDMRITRWNSVGCVPLPALAAAADVPATSQRKYGQNSPASRSSTRLCAECHAAGQVIPARSDWRGAKAKRRHCSRSARISARTTSRPSFAVASSRCRRSGRRSCLMPSLQRSRSIWRRG